MPSSRCLCYQENRRTKPASLPTQERSVAYRRALEREQWFHVIHLVFTATTPRPASVKEFEFVGYLLGRYVSYAVLPNFSVTAGPALYSYFSLTLV